MKQSLVVFLSSFGALLFSMANNVRADSAMWSSNPGNGLWTESTNWVQNTVPNGPADVATFGASSVTHIQFPAQPMNMFELNSIVFNAGASAYTISVRPAAMFSPQLTISGAGFINNSGITQNVVNSMTAQPPEISRIHFINSATAGSMMVFLNARGSITFGNSASAGNATFVNVGATHVIDGPSFMSFGDNATAGHSVITNTAPGGGGTRGAILDFFGSSTAGESNITNDGETFAPDDVGARTNFRAGSNAGGATITSHGGLVAGADGGFTTFFENSSASHATLIANGGVNGGGGGEIRFSGGSGGTSRVEVFGNGLLRIGGFVTIGSLEGTGLAFVGASHLTVGANHRSTIFSGVIQDGGASGGKGGSLTKIGLGNLTLSGSNTYTGPTTVNSGKLLVDGSITSAVTVNGGALGGSGNTGSVNVNSGGTLAPGRSAAILDVPVNGLSGGAGILHVAGNVVLTLGATYLVDLNGAAVGTSYDQIAVMGAVNLGGAMLSLSLGFAPTIGDVFTIVDNDAADAIGGTFDGLAEGDQITAGGETFAISYQGGDGNDVTLTSAAHEPGFSGPVPEPATWALLLMIAVVFAAHSMLRRRRA